MKYNKYIISFLAGSSGRFVKFLLDRIIRGSSDQIRLTPFNSAHLDDTYTGISMSGLHDENIYDKLVYDEVNPSKQNSNIVHTHVYPKFDKINSRFNDIGIILIKLNYDDMYEVLFNSVYKNNRKKNHGIVDNIRNIQTSPYSNPAATPFYETRNYPENCLILPYGDIYEKDSEKYRILEILKEFTGITEAPLYLNTICEQYISNRNSLINQYNLR